LQIWRERADMLAPLLACCCLLLPAGAASGAVRRAESRGVPAGFQLAGLPPGETPRRHGSRATTCGAGPAREPESLAGDEDVVVKLQSLQELQAETGWRDGDRFLFGYGALLAREVWRRRGIDEALGGRRQAVRVVARGRGLCFRVKGGWASVEPLPFSAGQQRGYEQEAHGIIVPVSDAELVLHAAKEGGYEIGEFCRSLRRRRGSTLFPFHSPSRSASPETISVRPYGSELEVAAVAFVASWWRRTKVLWTVQPHSVHTASVMSVCVEHF